MRDADDEKLFVFYIELDDAEHTRVEWRGLTGYKAKTMYDATFKRLPDNVRVCGWEEQDLGVKK